MDSSGQSTFLSLSRISEDWKVLLYVTFLGIAAKNNAGVMQGDQNDVWFWTPHSLVLSLDLHIIYLNYLTEGKVGLWFPAGQFAELSWEL